MQVRDVRKDAAGTRVQLSAHIETGVPILSSSHAFVELQGIDADRMSLRGDPFVAAMLPPAMRARERLELEAPVSSPLMENCPRIAKLLGSWDLDLTPVEVKAPTCSPPATGDWTGQFFSCGVDSYYTLLKNLEGSKDRPTHLIHMIGFTAGNEHRSAERETMEDVRKAAACLGLRVILVRTNLRYIVSRRVHWDLYHGAVLAAIALTLSGQIGRVVVPSSYSRDDLQPWGTHPSLDPLWSNGSIELVHDMNSSRRLEKLTANVIDSPLALSTLRVCWRPKAGVPNCGRCSKCLYTMLALHLAGALDRCPTFPPLRPEAVVRTAFNSYQRKFISDLLPLLGNTRTDVRLRLAFGFAVQKGRVREIAARTLRRRA